MSYDYSITFDSKWGSYGSGDGQVYLPLQLKYDSVNSKLIVIDSENDRAQRLTASGSFVSKFGTTGSGDTNFSLPKGCWVTANYIYVADSQNHRIVIYTLGGSYVNQFGSDGSTNGLLHYPYAVAVDSGDNIYVADTYNHRIQKFNSSGTYVAQWGTWGQGSTNLDSPCAIHIDSSDKIYVADSCNHRIQVFNTSGTLLTSIGSWGTSDGLLNWPEDIFTDQTGSIFVLDSYNHRLQWFDSTGSYVNKTGTYDTTDGNFDIPEGITYVPALANVYVADSHHNQIQLFKFDTNPKSPTNCTATKQTGSVIRVAWTDNSSNEDGFKIERSDDGGAYSLVSTRTAGTVYWDDTTVVPGVIYQYRVYAYRGSNISYYAYSGQETCTVDIKLTWTANTDDTDGYYIYRGTNSGGPFSIIVTSPTILRKADTQATDNNIVRLTKYWYVIRSRDAAGNVSATSTPVGRQA